MPRRQCKVINMSQTQEKRESTEITPNSPKLAAQNVKPSLITMLQDVRRDVLKKNEKMRNVMREI